MSEKKKNEAEKLSATSRQDYLVKKRVYQEAKDKFDDHLQYK